MQCKEHRRVVQICVVVLVARLYMGFESVCRCVDVVRDMGMQCGRVTRLKFYLRAKRGEEARTIDRSCNAIGVRHIALSLLGPSTKTFTFSFAALKYIGGLGLYARLLKSKNITRQEG